MMTPARIAVVIISTSNSKPVSLLSRSSRISSAPMSR